MGYPKYLGYFFLVISFEEIEAEYGAVAIGKQFYGFFYILHPQFYLFFVRLLLFRQVAGVRFFDVYQVQPSFSQLIDRLVNNDSF